MMKNRQSGVEHKVKSLTRILDPRSSAFCSVALVGAIYVLTLCVLERQGFWCIDNANKFLQVQAITKSNYSDYSIPWPGRTIDPDFEYNPLNPPFSQVKDQKLFSPFSIVFATVSSVFFRLFGISGLYVLPVACSVLTLAGLAGIIGAIGLKTSAKHTVVLVAGLCTPIWFYSVTFWEHIVAVCFCIWGVYFYLRFLKSGSARQLVIGSILASLGIYFRDELYLFCVVLVCCAVACSPGRRLKTASLAVAGMIAGVVPLWFFQWAAIGEPFGFHLTSHVFSDAGIAEFITKKPAVVYNLFLAANPKVWVSLAVTVPFVVAFLINLRFSRRAFILAVPLYSLIAIVSSFFALWGYFASPSPIFWMVHSCSLFTTVPVLILSFLRLKDPGDSVADSALIKWIWIVALVYAGLYGLTAPQMGSRGIHWGNRLLLVLYPLFAVLAAVNLVQWFKCFHLSVSWRTLAVALAILISFAAQLYSMHLLHKKKNFSYRLSQEIQKRPEQIVMCPVWWAPQELFSAFYNKKIFHPKSREHLEQLVMKLRSRGHDEFLLVSKVPKAKRKPAVATVDDEGLGYYSLTFFVIKTHDSHQWYFSQ
jgi:hypothetical protein